MLTLADVKKHLNIDDSSSFTEDDSYIETLLEAAKATVLQHLNMDELPDEKPIDVAVMLLVANWYANREAVSYGSVQKLPLGYEYILNLFRHY